MKQYFPSLLDKKVLLVMRVNIISVFLVMSMLVHVLKVLVMTITELVL